MTANETKKTLLYLRVGIFTCEGGRGGGRGGCFGHRSNLTLQQGHGVARHLSAEAADVAAFVRVVIQAGGAATATLLLGEFHVGRALTHVWWRDAAQQRVGTLHAQRRRATQSGQQVCAKINVNNELFSFEGVTHTVSTPFTCN